MKNFGIAPMRNSRFDQSINRKGQANWLAEISLFVWSPLGAVQFDNIFGSKRINLRGMHVVDPAYEIDLQME